MPTVCKLPRLPRKPDDGAEVCDKYGNRWRFSGEQDSWISRGLLQAAAPVTETTDGIVTTDIYDRLQKVRTFVNSGFDLRPLKIAPGRDAYWYYFRSSDKFIRFQPEGEDALRIEVDRGRLFQVLMKQVCPGPRGDKGDIGDRGREGKPGPSEICYEPSKVEKNRLDFSIITPTPLLGDRSDIELPNNHIPDISVRVFKVTLPRRTDGLVASKVGTKPKAGEVAVYDPLQHLAIYYHGLPAEAAAFQATRDLLVKQSMGSLAVNICDIPLSRILAIPVGSVVDRVPVVTVLVDPLGVEKPRVSYDRRFPVDVNKSLNTIKYNPETGIVCGSIYLQNNLPWEGTFCVKSRQRGPDGQPGKPGESAVRIAECTLDQTSVFATCPIITTRLDCEQQAIFSICSDIVSQVCVEGVKLAANSGSLNDRTALNTSFAAAQMVLDDCKLVESFTLELVDDEFDDLDLAHWSPQPGCVTKRHYDRHKFNWVKETDVPACDAAVKWYGPNGVVRPGKYPWYLGKAKPPEQDECCQEDFFYCPNVQVGCTNTGNSGGGSNSPPAPPPPPAPTQTVAKQEVLEPVPSPVLPAPVVQAVEPAPVKEPFKLDPTEILEPYKCQPFNPAQPPRSKFALVTLATGPKGDELIRISGPFMEAYAQKYGLDYYVIRGEPGPFPVGRKWDIRPYFDHYDRIVWLDADVLIHPQAPNLLEMVPEGTIGLHDDWYRCMVHNQGNYPEWIMAEYKELAESQGWTDMTFPEAAWNSGIYVADKEHAFVFDPPTKPYPKRHCVEQWHETLLIWRNSVPVTNLPAELNWQWWFKQESITAPIPGVYFYHYAGMDNPYRLTHSTRVMQMKIMASVLKEMWRRS